MYAVIQSGGKQHRIQVGDVVQVEQLAGGIGDAVTFEHVLMVAGDDATSIGAPEVDGAQVRGSIVEQGRDKKIVIYTYKRRQNSNRRRAGHRQNYTAVKIESIDL